MTRVLIAYFSSSGNTEKMAEAIARGARGPPGTDVSLRRVEQTSLEDLTSADAIVIGSPTYYGLPCHEVKRLLDESVKIHGKLEGKVGAAFTSSGGASTGSETTVLSIIQAMLVHGMIVQGDPSDKHYGMCCVGSPGTAELKLCRRFGRRISVLARRLSCKDMDSMGRK